MARHEVAAGAALAAIAVWEMAKTYKEYAPPLGELRRADRDDTDTRQRLRDADVTVGGLALLVGALAAYVTQSWIPLAIAVGAFAWISGLAHAVQGGITPEMIS